MYQVQKKRRSGWWLLALFLCAFVVGLGIGFTGVQMNWWGQRSEAAPGRADELMLTEQESTDIPDQTASVTIVAEEEVTQAPEMTYYVAAQADKVCVFTIDEKGQKRFSHNLAIELDALREEDKQLFYEGITVYSKQELSSLVEDFSS